MRRLLALAAAAFAFYLGRLLFAPGPALGRGPARGLSFSLQSVTVRCDKTFEIQVAVKNESSAPNDIGFSVGVFDNILRASPNPRNRRWRGGEVFIVSIEGELTNHCAPGQLTLFISATIGTPLDTAIDIPAPAIQSAVAPPNPVATATGEFAYTITPTCCPAPAAAAYDVKHIGGRNISTATPVPNVVNCPGPAPVIVTGQLNDPRISGTVEIEVSAGASRCVVITRIAPLG